MKSILSVWELPAFHSFIKDGYVSHFIDGNDLHGNLPFDIDPSIITASVTQKEKEQVADVFNQASIVGEKLGYTLGDITCGNMISKDETIYLIDYEVIIDWPLNETYQYIWNNTKKLTGLI